MIKTLEEAIQRIDELEAENKKLKAAAQQEERSMTKCGQLHIMTLQLNMVVE